MSDEQGPSNKRPRIEIEKELLSYKEKFDISDTNNRSFKDLQKQNESLNKTIKKMEYELKLMGFNDNELINELNKNCGTNFSTGILGSNIQPNGKYFFYTSYPSRNNIIIKDKKEIIKLIMKIVYP